MERFSDRRGQATSEYVAIVLLVAVVFALAAGLTSGGVGGQVLAGLQRGLCRVAGTACARPRPPGTDLAPCPVERTTRSESLGGAVEVVNLGRSGTLTTVRGSDGSVTISLLDGTTLKGEAGLGLHVSFGRRRSAEARAGIGATIVSGRSWTLPTAAAARAFVDRYGAKATIGGKVVDAVRSGCSILCDAIGWRPHAELPPPDEQYLGRGATAELKLPLAVARVDGAGGALIGARTRRDGSSTWFLQVDFSLAADAVVGPDSVRAGRQQQAVVSYALDATGGPSSLLVHTVTRDGGSFALRGSRSAGSIGAGGGGQLVHELDATLDLHDPRNRAVADAFVAVLRDPLAIGDLKRRAAALHDRIEETGVVDRRTYALISSAYQLGAKFAIGAEVGADFDRRHEGMHLLSAETRLPGLPFLPRDDCRVA